MTYSRIHPAQDSGSFSLVPPLYRKYRKFVKVPGSVDRKAEEMYNEQQKNRTEVYIYEKDSS